MLQQQQQQQQEGESEDLEAQDDYDRDESQDLQDLNEENGNGAGRYGDDDTSVPLSKAPRSIVPLQANNQDSNDQDRPHSNQSAPILWTQYSYDKKSPTKNKKTKIVL